MTYALASPNDLEGALLFSVLRALVGAQSLTSDEVGYLDRSGSGDGSFDLGDLRAFLRRQPVTN